MIVHLYNGIVYITGNKKSELCNIVKENIQDIIFDEKNLHVK
jgi:hypothetical protein